MASPDCGTNKDEKYAEYMRYYPDKWEAMSALRRETGLSFHEANEVINKLFGITEEEENTAREEDTTDTGLLAQLKRIFSR